MAPLAPPLARSRFPHVGARAEAPRGGVLRADLPPEGAQVPRRDRRWDDGSHGRRDREPLLQDRGRDAQRDSRRGPGRPDARPRCSTSTTLGRPSRGAEGVSLVDLEAIAQRRRDRRPGRGEREGRAPPRKRPAPNASASGPLARMVLEAPCHAIALFVRQPPEGGHFKRLMVPVDGTVFTRAAVEFALAFAGLENATSTWSDVVAPGPTTSDGSQPRPLPHRRRGRGGRRRPRGRPSTGPRRRARARRRSRS